ncbi:galactofuranosyltransferase [Bifidobacterium ramosum]|uniref:Galactofuranosyltransferase n=1 Tax=Bifidobacterium ramosum TaxID=1798158 RepID=A0A6L4X1H1_9BIFI|nr:glycosyltransferase [Bifidobacterium ramosum]KAB8288608.1 galactofuranosyltransferase [Bifidobacterium ramosum]NEG71811.1 glycosyltransferase [Bifidobacterium ramosum]
MSQIKFANILLERNPRSLSYPSLYCKADGPVIEDETAADGSWLLYAKGEYDFSTYFNSLSVQKLRKYTNASRFFLHLELKGAVAHVLQTKGGVFSAHPEPVEAVTADFPASDDWQSVDLELEVDDDAVLVGFTIVTEGRVAIRNSYYSLEYDGELRPIELVLATTTFKKESFIERNIGLVKDQILGSGEDIADHFHMYVIDNGRTLDADTLSDEHVTVRPNQNVGGAGGFTRGMIEAMEQPVPATNILLMDDDVAVSPESIKRTYNLLRLLKPEYHDAMISGAMLNYEIGEDQWEDTGWMTPEGTFSPAKPGLRLTKYEDVIFNETFKLPKVIRESHQRYAAWWYCCIPISVIKENGLPLPVFVRCDDAEYGVRCGKEFITMNGLCIWHMSFHVRYNAAVERYQTTRNTMIAQCTTGFAPKSDFMYELHNNIRLELKKFGYENAELCLDAFEDFLKGPKFIAQPGAAEKAFMDANKHKEKMVSFEEVQRRAEELGIEGFDLSQIDRQLVDGDKPRTRFERLEDYVTNNGQRFFKYEGEGYAVIPVLGWTYPAGAIHNKKYLIVIDWYNKKGAIRVKDPKRYAVIAKRYERDLKYYKKNIERLRKEYSAAREELTSVKYWKHYLDMD